MNELTASEILKRIIESGDIEAGLRGHEKGIVSRTEVLDHIFNYLCIHSDKRETTIGEIKSKLPEDWLWLFERHISLLD